MSTPDPKSPPLPTNQNFSDFEKEALGEMVLKTVKSDLQQYLRTFHLQQMKDLDERMAGFEKRCQQKISQSLEQNIKLQLEAHFQDVVKACQKDLSQMTSPLFKRAEQDIQSLTHTVTKANEFCTNIQNQYALRWDKPFFALTFSTALAGALMGLILLLFQVPFLSVFLMNTHTREAYETGRRIIELRQELESQPTSKEATVQEVPKHPKKKKKSSKG